MNLMILSPGRRVDIVQYFKKHFHEDGGKVFTIDMSPYSPALYEGDEAFVVEKDFQDIDTYINKVIDICVDKDVKAIITLIDPELSILAENRGRFLAKGILPIVSDLDEIMITFDKYNFSTELDTIIKVIPTFNGYIEVKRAIENKEITFPIFAKIRDGSGSIGIGKVSNDDELSRYTNKKNYIFQPYLKEKEYGVDVYFDMIDGEIKSLFIKEKLNMRAGETDKSISVYREDIVKEILKLQQLKFRGPIDVDIFEDCFGELYINEINPRFGGGHTHAYNSGINFIDMILRNLKGEVNERNLGGYKKGIIMMKYSGVKFISEDELKVPK
ncbi:MAG: ATP-grasp domain-containing protein [Clostridium sp.]|uniref:ATP-grasp domain-containing protein n=1 Tax=Clostridium sp. TaxID=1506 RepID=UPI00305635BA